VQPAVDEEFIPAFSNCLKSLYEEVPDPISNSLAMLERMACFVAQRIGRVCYLVGAVGLT